MSDNSASHNQIQYLCLTLKDFNGGATDHELQKNYSNLLSLYKWVQRELSLGTSNITDILNSDTNKYLTKKHRSTYLSVIEALNLPGELLSNLPCLLRALQCAINNMAQQLLIIPRNAAEIYYLWVFDHLNTAFLGWFNTEDITPISRKYINVDIDHIVQNLRNDQVYQLEGFINYITHNPHTRTRENGIWGYAPFAKKLKMAVIDNPELAARIRALCFTELAKFLKES